MTKTRVEEMLKAKIVDIDTHERGGLGASNRGYRRGLYEALMLVRQIDETIEGILDETATAPQKKGLNPGREKIQNPTCR
jgi:hypothetical protein